MAIFIPEWPRVSGRELAIKRILNTLDETFTVRRVIHHLAWVPELFVCGPDNGWMAIAICDSPFSALDDNQLFDTGGREAFEKYLSQFSVLEGLHRQTNRKLAKLLVLWSCSTEEVRALSVQCVLRYGIRLISRERFVELGGKLLPRLLEPLDEEEKHDLQGHYFPETEIPLVCTAKPRTFHRDNSARLERYFLDTEQEWATKLDLELPQQQEEAVNDLSARLINGVAGSGKTLIALNRARLLALMYPKQKILVLIHNTPIVADIKMRLHRAYGGISGNLEITTFFAWAVRQWRHLFRAWPRMPQNPDHVANLIKHYRTRWADLTRSDAQLADEFDFINANLIASESEYQEISRAGRGFALRARERSQIWAMYEMVTAALSHGQLTMWSAVPRDICLAQNLERLQKYHHVLVDEAQFFSPSWFQVLKLALEADGRLFLCADPNQGFMKSRLSWKSVGIDVAGRTKKLRKSYRTSRAILQAASLVLAQATQGDSDDFLVPDFDNMEPGVPPALIYAASPQDAVDRVINEIAAISPRALNLSNILVICGDRINKRMLVNDLGKRIGSDKVWWMNHKEQKISPSKGYAQDYLRLVSLETATGLEASVVFLIGMEDLLSDGRRLDLEDEEMALEREERARKFYMAMTRAGQRLILVSSQRLPQYVESVFVQLEADHEGHSRAAIHAFE